MPAWIIIAIIIIMAAISSGNKETKKAQVNATQGANNSEQAQQQFSQRVEECGTRCADVSNDYSVKIEKE
jgi:hypothetical protein